MSDPLRDRLEDLQRQLNEERETNIRLLQKIRELNSELDDYFRDRQILTHLVDNTTEADE